MPLKKMKLNELIDKFQYFMTLLCRKRKEIVKYVVQSTCCDRFESDVCYRDEEVLMENLA